MIRAFVVDDELLAIERLSRMLEATSRVELVGVSSDPVEAVEKLRDVHPDVLFLDIHMPALSGFELLAELSEQPWVIFTTAYDRYALDAFRVNSIDYLLKPIEPDQLERALNKAERLCQQGERPAEIRSLLASITESLRLEHSPWLKRIASRSGDRVEPIDLSRVTHFFSKDKLTFAATAERNYVVDLTIADLEKKLDPARFIRVHRGIILSLDHVLDLHSLFGGRMVARLKDGKKTELTVSRDRVAVLKDRLGL